MTVPTPKVNTWRRNVDIPGGGGTVALDFASAAGVFMAGRVIRYTVKQIVGDAPTVAGRLVNTASGLANDQAAAYFAAFPPTAPAGGPAPDFADDNNGFGWPYDCLTDVLGVFADVPIRINLTSAGGGIAPVDTYMVTFTVEEWVGQWVELAP